jgi:diketogulonate reductase-like aldo/keto reductase
MYENETDVGTALAQSGLDRSQLFVTTKLQAPDAGNPRRALEQSLRELDTPYLDLWLIHWPTGDDASVWRAFMDAREAGLVRDIGVSNFSIEQIDELAALGVTPAVNQIRWSPLLFDASLVAAHQERGVVLEGYSGLKGGTLDHPVIREIAERLGRTTAQVIIRWHLQHGIVVIPKSQNEQRIASNADVGAFELSGEDMARLDSLGPDRVV